MTTTKLPNRKTGERLRKLREGRGLTQLDVYNATRIQCATLSRYERGDPISPGNAFVLAEFYGIDWHELWQPPTLRRPGAAKALEPGRAS